MKEGKRTVKSERWFENSQKVGRLDERHRKESLSSNRVKCPQGSDLAFTKPTRDAVNMLHSSFKKTKWFLSENNLQDIAEDIFFPSFTTLHVEHFFAGMKSPSHPTPDMYDYASRRPSCIIKFVQKVHNLSFSMYTGLQRHYTERKIDKKEPEWLYERAKIIGQNKVRREDSVKETDVLEEEARDMKLFAKEFGQGVRQQRVRDKIKKRARTLPLALTMIRRVISPQTDNAVDVLEELQALKDGEQATPAAETRSALFSKGDVLALKHKWKQYWEPFFLAILCHDLHSAMMASLSRPCI